jgi:hypothetical protein
MQYKQYKKDFTRDEVAPEIATVKKFMAKYNSQNNSGMIAFKDAMAKFSPEVKQYYEAVVAQIKAKKANGAKQEYFRACCQNPKGTPGIPCKCYQGAQKYIAAVKYILADKKAA